MHGTHIQFFNFGNSQNLFGVTDRLEISRDCITTTILSSQKISNWYTNHCSFYGFQMRKIGCVTMHVFPFYDIILIFVEEQTYVVSRVILMIMMKNQVRLSLRTHIMLIWHFEFLVYCVMVSIGHCKIICGISHATSKTSTLYQRLVNFYHHCMLISQKIT